MGGSGTVMASEYELHGDGDDTRLPRLSGQAGGSPRAMAMMSAALHLQGHAEQALALALAAVAAAPDDMVVQQAVRTALSAGIPRFHEPMLNDHVRNRAYAAAIERAVKPGMTVLEIGAGSGLLAMIAARAGARVVTCEAMPIVAAAAREIVARNGYADRVRVVAKRSTELEIGVDLDAPADLLIHEIFGHMLVNEGVTAAIADARARLLKPGAPSVPPRAEIRIALAEFVGPRRVPIGQVEGFDLSPFNVLLRPRQASILTAAGKVVARSAPQSLLRMDYDSPAPFGPERETVRLASTGGRVDLIAQWMHIEFEDGASGDGQVLGSDPFGDGQASSWGAPLFPLSAALDTRAGDAVEVTARHSGTALTIDAVALG